MPIDGDDDAKRSGAFVGIEDPTGEGAEVQDFHGAGGHAGEERPRLERFHEQRPRPLTAEPGPRDIRFCAWKEAGKSVQH